MLSKKTLILFLICSFLCLVCAQVKKRRNRTKATTKYPYRVLFRHHAYYELSERAKEVFYAANVHPSCVEKKGTCIPRAQCTGREVLYISRVCYRGDMVCCYVNTIAFPETAWKEYQPPPPRNTTHHKHTETTPLP